MAWDSALTVRKLEEILAREFAPTELAIEDQSHHHRGHRQAGGGGHFFVTIRSAKFAGLTPLARQRLVLAAVSELMQGEIHALSLNCQPS
jgi:BolA family transcriptional regulator, general stress-responsive regulator